VGVDGVVDYSGQNLSGAGLAFQYIFLLPIFESLLFLQGIAGL
jgi:hypothetical protein